jgi:hydrogenase maturation factor
MLLDRLPSDARVVVGPGVGRDAAAIDLGVGRLVVAASDPVTFASDQIGRYAVHVNANDVACLGAVPRWFLATVLLPQGSSPELAELIFKQIVQACGEIDVTPIGGHTEITIGIDHPIIAGTMIGETAVDRLLRPGDAQPGDHIVLTQGIAIEGTAVLARDAGEILRQRGLTAELISRGVHMLDDPGISVLLAARIACDSDGVRALHDATEGGLIGALAELSMSSGCGVRLRRSDVSVRPETLSICSALGIDPFGLLASGALLIVTSDAACPVLQQALAAEGIPAACIGDLTASTPGAIIDENEQPVLPFERDELARFFATLGGS